MSENTSRRMGLSMKLYDCKRQSYITIDHDTSETVYFFDHLDGMYSYCQRRDGKVIHIAAYTDVKVVKKPENWDDEEI